MREREAADEVVCEDDGAEEVASARVMVQVTWCRRVMVQRRWCTRVMAQARAIRATECSGTQEEQPTAQLAAGQLEAAFVSDLGPPTGRSTEGQRLGSRRWGQ